MKLIIDIDDKRIKGIKLLAKEQDITTPYPTLEQIIANGIPMADDVLNKIRVEIGRCKTQHEMQIAERDTKSKLLISDIFCDVIEIIDKYSGVRE